ncbi:conserved hypothetical protein [Verticillium alfalfae VaMs.102]|uniref:CUE domain-containing protein n=1 Tax=Verticillium alfalfae (strain VaMs.102 / ATCC MYA-4576 / FGSC 10136) TaxID=526221 RepID=C9SFJ9_VERA1|nr:conserved hypothetical protein [Verticillium alfalfae VaMs.102]EEY17332.1 conserved hypothetical protein [Verticillium alfalfae VaMs.102]
MVSSQVLPPLAPFPPPSLRSHLSQQDWDALLDAWDRSTRTYCVQADDIISQADSLTLFLASFVQEVAQTSPSFILGASQTTKSLLNSTLNLFARRIAVNAPPELTRWQVLADASKLYTKAHISVSLSMLFSTQPAVLETSLSPLKKSLITQLDAGFKTDIVALERTLTRLNHLIHASRDVAAFILAGSDLLDGLVTRYKIMNPPLRKVIIATTYLCLVGLTEDGNSRNTESIETGSNGNGKARWGMLADSLFELISIAEAHRSGPLNVNDSLVAEIVSATPLLSILLRRAEDAGTLSPTLKARLETLQGFKKAGVGPSRPRAKRRRQKVDKGKGLAEGDAGMEMHIHSMSQIAVIQDLFPDLGSGFVAKLLDEFGEDPETVIAKLLEDDLPPALAAADRAELLSSQSTIESLPENTMAPRSAPTPSQNLPQRRNIFDDDELTSEMTNLHFGKRNPAKTADDVLADRKTAPNKAAIMSALAAFDSDDDERDDTYDADDVGGAVDTAAGGEDEVDGNANEETLFRGWQADSKVFDRDAGTRRSDPRGKLREITGMTDEAIEGWAVMLGRNPRLKRRLEIKYNTFTGIQTELASTSWRGRGEDSGTDPGVPSSFRGGRGGGSDRGRGRGGGGGGRNVAGPASDKDTEAARRRKEANKGSKANHNRRDQRAKKMARGGFPG